MPHSTVKQDVREMEERDFVSTLGEVSAAQQKDTHEQRAKSSSNVGPTEPSLCLVPSFPTMFLQ